MRLKIFVGYASEDRQVALDVVAFLETLGLEVWFDRKSLVAGDDWDAERLAAQRSADIIIHICSEQILTRSGVVNREIRETLRLAEDKPFGSNFAIFIRVGNVRLPAQFLRYHYIDFESEWQQGLAAAVGKKAGTMQMASAPPASYKRDSVNIHERFSSRIIEEKEKAYEISIEYIEYKSSETYWRMINSHIEAKCLEQYFDFKSDVPDIIDENSEYFRPAEFHVKTEEFFCSGEFISLRYFVHVDMGGAHGNHRTLTSNFFGSQRGKITIHDLLENDDEKAKKLLSYCLTVLEAGFDETDAPHWLVDKSDASAAWGVLENFNFDNRGVTFNFSPYDVLPYVAGDHEVNMPWQVAANYFAEKYMEPWYQSSFQ